MCDTIVDLGNSTVDGQTLFGKNSDRPPNEAQLIVYYPSKEYESEAAINQFHCEKWHFGLILNLFECVIL